MNCKYEMDYYFMGKYMGKIKVHPDSICGQICKGKLFEAITGVCDMQDELDCITEQEDVRSWAK